MFSLDQVACFVAAADAGSFSAAARKLGKSQSAVSIGVSNLELTLGVELFDRRGKYPVLTEAGMQLYRQGQTLLRQADRMMCYAHAAEQGAEDKLVVGLGPLVPISLLESLLEQLGAQFPDTVINLVRDPNDRLEQQLRAGELSMLLQVVRKGIPDTLDFFTVANMAWCCVCSPDHWLVEQQPVGSETLLVERQICVSAMLDNPLLKQGVTLSQTFWTATDQEDLVRLVEQGLGWAFMPRALLKEREAIGTLVQLECAFLLTEIITPLDLLLLPNQTPGPAQSRLIELLKQLGNC